VDDNDPAVEAVNRQGSIFLVLYDHSSHRGARTDTLGPSNFRGVGQQGGGHDPHHEIPCIVKLGYPWSLLVLLSLLVVFVKAAG
jgi:hypothetical protein